MSQKEFVKKYKKEQEEGLSDTQLELFDKLHKFSISYGVCRIIVTQAEPGAIREAMTKHPDDIWGYLKKYYGKLEGKPSIEAEKRKRMALEKDMQAKAESAELEEKLNTKVIPF